MKTLHTPGPWTQEGKIIYAGKGTLGEILADCVGDNRIDNAKLMAAAPELLQALEELRLEVERMCSIGSDPAFMSMLQKRNKAIEAIQKATGSDITSLEQPVTAGEE